MNFKKVIALFCVFLVIFGILFLPNPIAEAKEDHSLTEKLMIDPTNETSLLANKDILNKSEEKTEVKVFEEPMNYDLNSMQLKATELAEVEDGKTSSNDLFDFEAFIKEADITDGTAPFDKDNQAGNDSGESNGMVRTFDTVTYPIKITINPKNVDKLENIVLKITGTMENGISDKKRVNARFSVGGYEDLESGVVGFEQTYTIAQTGNSIMVPIALDVQGAKNGITMKPNIKVEVISVGGKDISGDNVEVDFNNLPTVKTSGKVNIKAYAGKHNYGSNTFNTVPYAVLDAKTEKDTNIFGYYIAIGLQKLDGRSDMKGTTFPSGKIKYHMDLVGSVAWDGGSNAGTTESLSFLNKDTPLSMIDHQPIDGITQKKGNENTQLNGQAYNFKYPNGYPTARSKFTKFTQASINQQSFYSVWDSGKWTITKPKITANTVTYSGEIENYIIGSTFPEYRADGWTGGKIYGANDKVFATNGFMVEQPNEYVIGGKNNTDGLANNVYYEANVVIDSYVGDDGKDVVVHKGASAISSERNNPAGSMHVQNTFVDHPTGIQLGTPNNGNGAVSKGDVSTILGKDVKFRGYARSTIINYGGFDLVTRWNTDAFELTRQYAQEAYNSIMTSGYMGRTGEFIKNNYETQKVFYGIPKFTDNSFSSFTSKGDKDYTWYDNYTEAMKNGSIGAMMISVNDVVGASSFQSWYTPLHVKTKKIGSFNEKGTANIAVSNLYAYPSKDRSKRIDVHADKSYQSPSLWNDDGTLQKKQSPVGDSVNFETLSILNAETTNVIKTDKATYYNSETVNWTVKSDIILPPTGAPENFDGSVSIRQILPKGLDYKVGSGKQGSLAKEPKITKNNDGTTILDWDLLVSKAVLIDDITFATTINPFALTSGVQSSLTVTSVISSPLDTRKEHLRKSSASINILKVGMVGIYSSINELYGEKNSAFSIELQPYTTIEEEQDVMGITVLPQNKDRVGSTFSGTALLKSIAVTGDNKVSIYLNNNIIETSDPHKVDINKNGWYKYTASGQNISNAKTILFHVEGVLANDDDVRIKLGIQTKDNKFGNTYVSETTINSATDYLLSPISNRVKFTIRADVELSLERIQIYTKNHKSGLPVKIRVNKEVNRDKSLNETLKLVIYDQLTNKIVTEKTYTVNELLRENEILIPSNVLEKDKSKSYEVRIEGYDTNRLYASEGKEKIDTKGYTASEKELEANVVQSKSKALDYSGVIMTEREIGKDIVEFYETLSIPLSKIASVKSGYGLELKQSLSYSNELNILEGIKAKYIVDNKLIDTYLEYPKDSNGTTIELSSEEDIVNGNSLKQTMILPKVYVEEKTGKLFSEEQVLNEDSRITNDLKDGGKKLYTPIWIDSVGSYPISFQTDEPVGINEVKFNIIDTIDIEAFMYGYIGSETIDKDEILLEPVNLNNPFPNGLPDGWTQKDVEWLKK